MKGVLHRFRTEHDTAVKVILKEKYKDYNSALGELNLMSLSDRREILCLRFATKSLKLQNFRKLFPHNKKYHVMNKRKESKFFVNQTKTERYKKSSIPYMQRLLNKEEKVFKNCLVRQSNVNLYASELCQPGSITNDNLNYNK